MLPIHQKFTYLEHWLRKILDVLQMEHNFNLLNDAQFNLMIKDMIYNS